MGDLGSILGLERSPGEGNSYPLQYSGLENSMDCIVHEVAKSQTRLSDFHFSMEHLSDLDRVKVECLVLIPGELLTSYRTFSNSLGLCVSDLIKQR